LAEDPTATIEHEPVPAQLDNLHCIDIEGLMMD
jgi:hypothetical protein